MNFRTILFISLSVLEISCNEIKQDMETPVTSDGINISVTAPNFITVDDTKSTISTSGAFTWSVGDRIGIYSNQIGATKQTPSQLALTLFTGEGSSAVYSCTTGWHLVTGSTFNYFSYYPYSETNTREKINIDYTGQTQTANNSTAELGEYDYMYSSMAAATTASSASFSFHHIGCPVNVSITVPEGYKDTTFYSMRLYADSKLFTSSATYSVDDIATSGSPSLDAQSCSRIKLSFGDAGIKPTNGVINAWVMMAPAQWKDKTITAKLYVDIYDIPTLSGTFTPDANQIAGTQYCYSVTSSVTGQNLPDKPVDGEKLHILLFGHSFGVDCTEYLPTITKAAGINDVHYGRWYEGNCSLAMHWRHITARDVNRYYDSNPITGNWKEMQYRMVDDVLSQYPWDIIIFQQSIGFDGAGDYRTYQPYLNNLTHHVTNFCKNAHGKYPIIGWNMFWGYNSQWTTDYDRDATLMYYSIVQATKEMLNDKNQTINIRYVIPSGTAIQNARNTSLNDPGSETHPSTTKILTRDAYHTTYGIGRYTTACTWFQYLIAPIYGVDITGNTYRPTAYSFEKDLVTDERAAICWKCAKAAVEHPFEVTPIEE